MQNWIYILIALMIPAASFAQGKKSCARCEENRKLAAEFTAIKYENAKERAKGRTQYPKVESQIEKFTVKAKGAARVEEFKSLVELIAAALPYDMETQGPGLIADAIGDSQALRSAYNDTLAGLTDSCRKDFLKNTVEERACYNEAEKRGNLQQQGDRCIRAFDYAHCVGVKLPD